MKLIELLRTLDSHTYVRIAAIDSDKLEIHNIVGEKTTVKGWASLIDEVMDANCTDYVVTYIHCLWHAQELYIGCMKL